MSNPFLNLAIGALKGNERNRERAREEEDRRRQRERDDLEFRLRLAELASTNPDFEFGAFPFVEAATPAPGGAAPGAAAPAADVGAAVAPTPGPRGPGLDELPAAGGGAGPGIGAPPRSDSETPFVDHAVDLGNIELGGEQYGVRAHPGRGRARQEAKNRAAFEALHEADPEAYPAYIDGANYAAEMADYAAGIRAGRIEDKRARREGRAAASRTAADRRRDGARDMAFRLFQEGRSFDEVVSALSEDHEYRGVLTRSEIRREQQNAGAVDYPGRQKQERIARLRVQLGKPPTPLGTDAPVDAQLQQDVIEALADGSTADEVLEALGNAPEGATVRRWLRRGRQLGRGNQ